MSAAGAAIGTDARERGLWTRVAQTGGASLFASAASMLTLVLTSRALGPSARGVYVTASTWVLMASALGALSLGQVLVHAAAESPGHEWAPEAFGTAAMLTAASTVVAWIVAAVVYVATGGASFRHLDAPTLAVAFAALPALMLVETGRYALTAIGRLTQANVAQVVGAATGVVAVLVLVVALDAGVIGALGAGVVSATTTAALMFVAARRHVRRFAASAVTATRMLRGSARLHFNAVGSFLVAQSSVLIANQFVATADTAYYQLAIQLLSFGLLGSAAIGSVSYELVAKHGPDAAWPTQRRLLTRAIALSAAAAAAGYVLAPVAVRLVAGDAFAPAVPLLRLVLPSLVGATMANVMASQWIGRGFFARAAGLTIASGALSVALDVLLIPRFGVRGACVSTLAIYGVSVLSNGGMALWVQRRARSARAEVPA